jgi:single-strand DNA-binding protein
MAYHKLTVIGKVAGELRSRDLPSGGRVVSFGLPINFTRPKKNPETGKWEGESFFINVDVFNKENYKIADIVAQTLRKGSLVYIEGRLRNNEYTDKNGVKISRPVLVADVIEFLDARPEGEMGGETISRAPTKPVAASRPALSARSDDFDESEMEPAPRHGGAMSGGEDSEIPF